MILTFVLCLASFVAGTWFGRYYMDPVWAWLAAAVQKVKDAFTRKGG